jgi:Histidine kinase-, DNA gyrase B-, and HSP90-like ATPase
MATMSSMSDAVSIRGMLQNELNRGVTPVQCLSEFADNSFSAGATQLILWIDTVANILCISDDAGIKKDLRAAFRFHERSTASEQHGRFGMGAKFAIICLTNLKSIARIFTRPNRGDRVKQLDLDFPTAVHANDLTINPHGLEEEYVSLWKKHAIKEDHAGSVFHLPCDASIMQNLVSMITSVQVENSLRYQMGTSYCTDLSAGKKYQIILDGKEYPVVPMDRLCWDDIPEEDKMEVVLSVFYHPESPSDVRAYYTDPFTEKYGYRLKMNFGRTDHFVEEDPLDNFKPLGNVIVQLAYSEDWVSLMEEPLKMIGVEVPKKVGRASVRKSLGGVEFVRNEKVVKVLPTKKPGNGDRNLACMYENTKMRVSFQAVMENQVDHSKTMDDVFGTQVIKSELNENGISPSVQAAPKQLQSDFVKMIFKRTQGPMEDSGDELVSDDEKPLTIMIPGTPPKSPVSAMMASKAAKPAPMPKPTLMPAMPAKPAAMPAAKPAAMPAANPASVVSVAPHIRNQSKSPHDIIKHFRDLVGTYGGYAAEMTERASIVTEPKLVNIAVALTALEEMLQQLSQKTTK